MAQSSLTYPPKDNFFPLKTLQQKIRLIIYEQQLAIRDGQGPALLHALAKDKYLTNYDLQAIKLCHRTNFKVTRENGEEFKEMRPRKQLKIKHFTLVWNNDEDLDSNMEPFFRAHKYQLVKHFEIIVFDISNGSSLYCTSNAQYLRQSLVRAPCNSITPIMKMRPVDVWWVIARLSQDLGVNGTRDVVREKGKELWSWTDEKRPLRWDEIHQSPSPHDAFMGFREAKPQTLTPKRGVSKSGRGVARVG